MSGRGSKLDFRVTSKNQGRPAPWHATPLNYCIMTRECSSVSAAVLLAPHREVLWLNGSTPVAEVWKACSAMYVK